MEYRVTVAIKGIPVFIQVITKNESPTALINRRAAYKQAKRFMSDPESIMDGLDLKAREIVLFTIRQSILEFEVSIMFEHPEYGFRPIECPRTERKDLEHWQIMECDLYTNLGYNTGGDPVAVYREEANNVYWVLPDNYNADYCI